MSLDRIFNALVDLGLSEIDSKVYITIAVKGPMTARTILEEIQINKQQLYPILKKLQRKNMIEVTDKRPSVFSALPFEQVLDMLINCKIKKSKEIIGNKEELLSCWEAVNWNNGK
jgi:sugar-specific transcriptional regulator TrmB